MTGSARLAVVLALSVGAVAAADAPSAPRAEVEQFVRAYVEANNATDPAAVMDLMSRRPDVSSVTMGAVSRGLESIRRETGTLAGMQGAHRMAPGTMDVIPLGPGYALVVAQVTFELAAEGSSSDLHGALTLVVEKSSGKWKLLHEHVSLQFPFSDVQEGTP